MRGPLSRCLPSLTEGHLLGVQQVSFTNTVGCSNMAQRTLARPLGLALSSARTHCLVRSFSTVLDTPIDPKTQQVTPPTGQKSSVFENAVKATGTRTNWTKEEIAEIYNTPLIRLTYAAVRIRPSILESYPDWYSDRLQYTSAFMTRLLFRCVP
jgi:hypothetical protein